MFTRFGQGLFLLFFSGYLFGVFILLNLGIFAHKNWFKDASIGLGDIYNKKKNSIK